jgi:hypothetical protein|nr:MAG TPA: hypothetical protein [Caudoviricetes sp.]
MISQRKISEEFIVNGVRYCRILTINLENRTQKIKWYEYKKAKNAILDKQKLDEMENFYQHYILPDIRRYFTL